MHENGVDACCLCCLHPLILLQTAEPPSPREKQNLPPPHLRVSSGCISQLWWHISNVTMIYRESSRGTKTGQSRHVFLLDLTWEGFKPELLPFLSTWGTARLRVGHTWTENTAQRGGVRVPAPEPWCSWGRKWSWPQTFQLLRLSRPVCLFNLVWVFLQSTKSRVTWENVLLPTPMGEGRGAGCALGEVSFCNCYGSDDHMVWFFCAVRGERVSQSEQHIQRANAAVHQSIVVTEWTSSKPVLPPNMHYFHKYSCLPCSMTTKSRRHFCN